METAEEKQKLQLAMDYLGREVKNLRNRDLDSTARLRHYKKGRRQIRLPSGRIWNYIQNSTAIDDDRFVVSADPAIGIGKWHVEVASRIDITGPEFRVKIGEGLSDTERTINTLRLKAAVQSGRPLIVPAGIYEFNGNVLATDVPIDMLGLRGQARFIQYEDVDFLTFTYTTPGKRVQIQGIQLEAAGTFTVATALTINHYNVQDLVNGDPVHAQRFADISQIDICGKDAYTLGAVQEWKTGIFWNAANSINFSNSTIQGAGGYFHTNTCGLKFRGNRAAVDSRIRDVYIGLVTQAVDGYGAGYPGYEGVHFVDCWFIGNFHGVKWESHLYKAPGFQLRGCHIHCSGINVFAHDLTQLHIKDCYIYNQGNTDGQLSAFVALQICSDYDIAGNEFYVVPGDVLQNDPYGILVYAEPTNFSVAGKVRDNYIVLKPGSQNNYVWHQTGFCQNNNIYNNTGENGRYLDCWASESDFNHYWNNWPRDPKDGKMEFALDPIDGQPANGLKQVNAGFGFRSDMLVIRQRPWPVQGGQPRIQTGNIAKITAPFGKPVKLLFVDGPRTLIHSDRLVLPEGKDFVIPYYPFMVTLTGFPGIDADPDLGVIFESCWPLPAATPTTPLGNAIAFVGDLYKVNQPAPPPVTTTGLYWSGDIGITEGIGKYYVLKATKSSGPDVVVTTVAALSVTGDSTASISQGGQLNVPSNETTGDNRTVTLSGVYDGFTATYPVSVYDSSAGPYITQLVIAGLSQRTEGGGALASVYINAHMSSGPDQNYTGPGTYAKVGTWFPGMNITAGTNATCTVSDPTLGAVSANGQVDISFTHPGGTITGYLLVQNVADPYIPIVNVNNFIAQFFDASAAVNVLPTGYVRPNGGTWQASNGELCQTSETVSNDSYSVVMTENTLNSTEIVAVITPRSFTPGTESARFGVGLRYGTAANAGGYNLLFYADTNKVEFLHDSVAHGPNYVYNWQANVQYGFRMQYVETGDGLATLYGRIWKMSEPEPTAWPYTWPGQPRLSGYPALVGGATLAAGQAGKACIQEVYTFKPTVIAPVSHVAIYRDNSDNISFFFLGSTSLGLLDDQWSGAQTGIQGWLPSSGSGSNATPISGRPTGLENYQYEDNYYSSPSQITALQSSSTFSIRERGQTSVLLSFQFTAAGLAKGEVRIIYTAS